MTTEIGLAGAGDATARSLAAALATCASVRFAGVWGPIPTAAAALASGYRVAAYEDYDDLLARCAAVVFAMSPAAQPALASAAVRRGKAILVEAPIAADLAGAQELVKLVERADVVSQVALPWRFATAIRRFLDVDVPAAAPVGGYGRAVAPLNRATPTAGGGAERGLLRGRGLELIDLLDAALGHVVGVHAHATSSGWLGLLLEHQIGRASEASLYAGAPKDVGRVEIEVFGPGGSAALDCVASVAPAAVDAMLDEFADAVQRGVPPVLDIHHGLHLQDVIEEAESYLLLHG
jgi:predicted dehydrogenase